MTQEFSDTAPVASFTYHGKDYPAWSSFDSHYKPADSVIGKANRYAKLGKIADNCVADFKKALANDPLGQTGRLSYACLLMLLSGIRVGNEDSAEGYESGLPGNIGEVVKTYGVTTLLPEHVEVSHSSLTLNFLGKKQVAQSVAVDDPTLVKIGQQYLDNPQGATWLGIDLNSLTNFIRHNIGENFTPKDMRAFFANTYCYDLMRGQAGDKQSVKTIIEAVAKKLGNTAAVTKRNYLDSRMLDWFVMEKPTRVAKLGATYDSSSTQVNLPEDLAAGVIAWGKENIPDERIYQDSKDPTLGREDEIHVTVKFGLETTDVGDLAFLKNFPPVEIVLGKMDIFSQEKYDVVFIPAYSSQLAEMNKAVSALPNKDTHPVYKPHITVAYVKSGEGKQYVGNDAFDGKKFTSPVVEFSAKNKGGKTNIPLAKAAGYPSHPDNPIVLPNEFYKDGLTEKDVWEFYNNVRDLLAENLRLSTVLVITGVDGGLVRRNDPTTGEPIQVPDIVAFDRLNNGRTAEFHTVIGETTDRVWVDLDPGAGVPWGRVLEMANILYTQIPTYFRPEYEKKTLNFSGGRGFHIVLFLKAPIAVDEAQARLLKALDYDVLAQHADVTTSINKDPKKMRLDVSTLHMAGSIRAELSLNIKTGLVCCSVDRLPKDLAGLVKNDFTTFNVLRALNRLAKLTVKAPRHIFGSWLARTAQELAIPPRYKAIVDKLAGIAGRRGFTIYAVGGFVRDLLLGREPKDLDIMVEGDQGGIKFAQAVAKELGLPEPTTFPRFGTAMLQVDNEQIEFVMPRQEYYTEESRKPDTALGTVEQDALRRDFGMNAIFLRLNDMTVIDPTGHGMSDLKSKIIRVMDPGAADVIFSQDPLRMLRAIRQSLQLGFEIDPDTREAIKRNAERIKIISAERIRDELSKILIVESPSRGIRFLRETGLLQFVMPELEATVKVDQPVEWHDKDVFEHILAVLDKAPSDLITRLSALLHDIGKPATKSVVDNTVHFFEHERVGAELAKAILKRLKFPNDIVDSVSFLVGEHMRGHNTGDWSDKAVRRFVRDMGEHLERMLTLLEADATSGNAKKIEKLKDESANLRSRIDALQEEADIQKIPELLSGDEIMELFNFGPGPWIKDVKNYLKDQQDENPRITPDEAIDKAKEFMAQYDATNLKPRKAYLDIRSATKREFRFDPNSSANEGRWRLRDPKSFDQTSYRRWTSWAGVLAPAGVSFIVGKLKGAEKTALQAIRFELEFCGEEAAAKFWESVKGRPGFEKLWTPEDWAKITGSSQWLEKNRPTSQNPTSPVKNPDGEHAKTKDSERTKGVDTFETPRETHIYDQESNSSHPNPGREPSLNEHNSPLNQTFAPHDETWSVDTHP